MITVTLQVTIDGAAEAARVFDLDGPGARKLGDHLTAHALQKINAMAPDDDSAAGSHVVQFDYDYVNGAVGHHSTMRWTGIDDAGVGAIQGAFDAAMAKLDKHIAAKERKHQ